MPNRIPHDLFKSKILGTAQPKSGGISNTNQLKNILSSSPAIATTK